MTRAGHPVRIAIAGWANTVVGAMPGWVAARRSRERASPDFPLRDRVRDQASVKADIPLPSLKHAGLIATLMIVRRFVFATPFKGGAVVRVQRPLA
jgi:hypothetical protein